MSADDLAARGRELAESGKYLPRNGNDPYADVPPPDAPPGDEHQGQDYGPTTWEPMDLGPYLRGEVQRPEPSVGVCRSDGVQFLYPGREHSILGGTEAGKTWVALMCCAAELLRGNTVAYCHFEESDPGSTIERLRLLGVSDEAMVKRLRFAAPAQRVKPGWLTPLLEIRPSLAILDGINEAIVMHGQKVDLDGWSLFRQQVIVPFKAAGAAVLGCDHMPIASDEGRRDAYGTGHKGNILDGARLMLVNKEPFGRRLRGRSELFVTKDRPGQLRMHGKAGRTPGVCFIGTLIVDDSQAYGPDFTAVIHAPKPDERAPEADPSAELKSLICETVQALPACTVESKRKLLAALRTAGHAFKDKPVHDAIDDLVAAGRLFEVPGKRGSTGFRVVLSAAQLSTDSGAQNTAHDCCPLTASLIEGEAGSSQQTRVLPGSGEAVGSSGKQSGEQGDQEAPQ